MFENQDFIAWANENIVFVVGHQGKSHGAAKAAPAAAGGEESKTAAKDGCSLYPTITCEEHEKILEDAKAGTGGPKLDPHGFPNSFMITPDGKTVTQHMKDRVVKELEDGVADFAKKNAVKPSKKYLGYLATIETGDKAVAAGKWRDAASAYLQIDALGKKMPSLGSRLPAKIAALNDAVVEAFGKLKDDAAADAAAKFKSIKALRAEVGAKFLSGPLAVAADIDAWLKANPLPAAAPPPK